MNRKLGDVGDDSARIPSSAFFVEHAAPAEAAGGIASGGHRSQTTMTAGDLLKAEQVTLDVGTHKQLMEDVPIEKRLTLSFPHISAWVPDLLGPGSAQGGNIITKAFHKLKGGKPEIEKPKERQVRILAAWEFCAYLWRLVAVASTTCSTPRQHCKRSNAWSIFAPTPGTIISLKPILLTMYPAAIVGSIGK